MRLNLLTDLRKFKALPSYHKIGLIALFLLVFSLPFELERPTLAVGIYQMTNVELCLMASVVLAIFAVVRERRWRQPNWIRIPSLWLVLLGAFGLIVIISAVLAPEFKTNALKASFRTLSGLALALMLPQLVTDRRHLRWIMAILVLSGLLSVSLGLAELIIGKPFIWLNFFRIQPTVAGPFARLTGTFNHANQTAMYIEATLPFLLAVLWLVWKKRDRLAVLVFGGLALFYLQASFFTLSRSSFVTIFASVFLVAAMTWAWQWQRRRLALYLGGVAGLVLVLIGLNTWLSPVVRLRLSSEGDNEWYNASFIVPDEIEIKTGEVLFIPVTVINEGALYWSSQADKPFNLGGRWYRLSDNTRSDIEMRWQLTDDVAPGERLTMTADLAAPVEAGEYEFEWDMVQEDVIWFSLKNGRRTTSRVTVLPDMDSSVSQNSPDVFNSAPPNIQPIPNRPVLWSVAARQFMDRPFLGIGLDNFRLTYGKVLGWQSWNESIHTNNMYIEILVSVGIVGSTLFFGWLALLGRDFLIKIRGGLITIWQIALSISLLAFLIHGLLDYFLMFNGTGLLFWLLIGMWMVLSPPEPSV